VNKFKTKISWFQRQFGTFPSSFTLPRRSLFAPFVATYARNGGSVTASVDPQTAAAWERFRGPRHTQAAACTSSVLTVDTLKLALLLFSNTVVLPVVLVA